MIDIGRETKQERETGEREVQKEKEREREREREREERERNERQERPREFGTVGLSRSPGHCTNPALIFPDSVLIQIYRALQ